MTTPPPGVADTPPPPPKLAALRLAAGRGGDSATRPRCDDSARHSSLESLAAPGGMRDDSLSDDTLLEAAAAAGRGRGRRTPASPATPPFCAPHPAVAAYEREFGRVAAALEAALERGAPDDELSPLNAAAASASSALIAARRAALRAGGVSSVAAGAFVPTGARLLAWMGGTRPSDTLACARAKFAVWGESLDAGADAALADLQSAAADAQASLAAAFADLSASLARAAAVAAYVRSTCSAGDGAGTPHHARRAAPPPPPAALSIVDDMASLFAHADDLRAHVAARVAALLSPRQAALFWSCAGDTLALGRALDAAAAASAAAAAAADGGGGADGPVLAPAPSVGGLGRAGSGTLRVRTVS